jgi:CRISPR-associated protein Csd1
MILSALNDYYDRLLDSPDAGISPPGYSMEKISYVIVLSRQGDVMAVDDIRDTSGKKPVPKSLVVPQPEKRTAGIKPNFLWDKTSYVLGASNSSKRSDQEHAAFKRFHFDVLKDSSDEGLKALIAFLTSWQPKQIEEGPHFARHGDDFIDSNVIFLLDGEREYLHERQAAKKVRAALIESSTENKTRMCLVTGSQAPVARLHPAIKGVNGAQSSGASIVSFNLDSFSSYGKIQGENAPVSEQVVFSYTTTLNYLLRRDPNNRQRIQIGDTTVVFWAQAKDRDEAAASEDIFAVFLNPKDDDSRETGRIRSALELIKQGKPLSDLDTKLAEGTRMFVLGLAPNASRLSVRFWETDTLGAFTKRLAQHYDDLYLEPYPWRTPPAIWRLLLATAPSRDGKAKSEDVLPQLAGELARAILTGGPYPYSLLGNIIMRMRADGDISGTRVALVKGVLTRFKRLGNRGSNKGELPVSLDTSNTDPGYLLGRLFYLLENAQREAIKGTNAGVKEKFYGSASATPALVYPSLMRNLQNHLSKLRKSGEKEKAIAGAVERDVARIIDLLGPAFPKSLKLEAQGHFAIGYYHQSQARFAHKGNQDVMDSEEGENA